MNGFIGTKEAAERLHISVRRVQALIAAGRLPAEKIGNSYAIRESDLIRVNGRKNGRPKPPGQEQTGEEWNKILHSGVGSANQESRTTRQNPKRISVDPKILAKPPHERTPEEWNAIIDKLAGSVSLGPSDLSTNRKYLEGL